MASALNSAIELIKLLLNLVERESPHTPRERAAHSSLSSMPMLKPTSKVMTSALNDFSRKSANKQRKEDAVMSDLRSAERQIRDSSKRKADEAKRITDLYQTDESHANMLGYINDTLTEVARVKIIDIEYANSLKETKTLRKIFADDSMREIFRVCLTTQLKLLLYLQKTIAFDLHHLVAESFSATACLDTAVTSTSVVAAAAAAAAPQHVNTSDGNGVQSDDDE